MYRGTDGCDVQKARRQVMLARKRPSDLASTRVETTVLDHLAHSELVEAEFGASGFGRLAQLIQQAGAHNVSHTLGTIVTYLLLEPELLNPLRQELAAVWENRAGNDEAPTWQEFEKLPYLKATISEGLR
jgi:cytochrome P450